MTLRYSLPVLLLLSSSIMADDLSQNYSNGSGSAYSGSETSGFTFFANDETNDKKQIQTKTASGDQSMTIVDSNGNLKIVQPPAPTPRTDPLNPSTTFKESTPPLSSTAPTIPSPQGVQPPVPSSVPMPATTPGTSGQTMPSPTSPGASVPVSTPSLPAPTRVPVPQPAPMAPTVPAPTPLTTVPEAPSAPTTPVPPAAPLSPESSSNIGTNQVQGNYLSQ